MNWYKAGHREKDTKDNTASFAQAGTRENIQSGEKHKTLFGKIARYFADLKLVAFTGSYDDLNGKPSSFPPSSHTHTKSQVSDFAHTHKKAEITDFPTSMPASDVPAWAKAANKPSYNWSEIGEKDDVITSSNYKNIIDILDNGVIIKAENSTRDYNNSPYEHKAAIKAVKNDIIIEDSYYDLQNNCNNVKEMLRIRVSDGITPTNDVNGLSYGLFPIYNYFSFGNILYPIYRSTIKYLNIINNIVTPKITASSITENNVTYSSAINMYPKIIQFGCNINGGGQCVIQIVTAVSESYNKCGLVPGNNNNYTLGASNLKWSDIYCNNATIQTSDRNEKTRISYIGQDCGFDDTFMSDECVYDFVMGLLACIYNRVDADSGRPHHGFIAQDVKQLMDELGMTDHAAFIKSPKYINVEYEEEETYVDETDGQTKTRTVTKNKPELVPGEYVYGLRYEEFIPDITRVLQIQDKKIKEQDMKINSLEERLSILENMVKAS